MRVANCTRALTLALVFFPGCVGAPRAEGRWPPADFHLRLEHQVAGPDGMAVRRRADVFADGLVIYRETEGAPAPNAGSLPVFSRLCVYRLHPRSVRSLSRELHKVPVLRLQQPAVPLGGEEVREAIRMNLRYLEHRLDLLCQNRVFGLFNTCLRLCNSFLPPGRGFRMQGMAGDALEARVQDVPPLRTDPVAALAAYQELLAGRPDDPQLLRETFALALQQAAWSVAERVLGRLAQVLPGEAVALRARFRAARDR